MKKMYYLKNTKSSLPSPLGMAEFGWSGGREVSQFGLGPSSTIHLPLVLHPTLPPSSLPFLPSATPLPQVLVQHPNSEWMVLWLETDRPGEQVTLFFDIFAL